MKKLLLIFVVLSIVYLKGVAQIVNPATLDTINLPIPGKVLVGAYIDAYFRFDQVAQRSQPQSYGVSYDSNDEVNVNLGYVDVQFKGTGVRARIVPGFGTYMAANYNQEPIQLRNFIEASVGLKLFKNKNIWIDAGILGSPYTNESFISRDHLMLTRSLAAEYSPYYLSGIKLGMPLSPKVNFSFYLINGWQNIQETNKQKSIGTQVEYRPNNKVLLNWNTYLGYEEDTLINKTYRGRYFSDLYLIYNPTDKLAFTACIYGGVQMIQNPVENKLESLRWGTYNVISRYKINEKASLSGRVEYFTDPAAVVSRKYFTTDKVGFQGYSTGLCFNYKVASLVLLRLEGKHYFGTNEAFMDGGQNRLASNNLIVGGVNIIY